MKRIHQLDGVRALAILAVFLHHTLHVTLMWMGVDIFFVLSGFLITGVLLDAKHHSLGGFFAHFYSRRARRILPPYLLLLIVASFIFGVAWTHYWYLYILLTNFISPLNIPHPDAFDPLWSLAVEEQFYLVWPFAVYFLSRRRLAQLCAILIVVAPVLRGTLHFQLVWPVYMLTPFRIDLLATGGLLCLAWRSRREWIERWGTLSGGIFLAVGLVGLLWLAHRAITTYSNTRMGNVLIFEFCLFISLGIMLYALGGRGVGWLRSRPLTYIGQISYSMYLIHVAVFKIVQIRFSGVVAALITFIFTVAYASLSWTLLECPLLGTKRSKLKPQLDSV